MKSAVQSKGGLAIEYIAPSLLKADPTNPRVHPKAQLKKLVRSFEQFGFAVPVLIYGKNRIIAGHGCVQAAQLAGIREIPIVRLEGLSESKARAFGLAHNRLAEDSSWDNKLLGEILKTLSLDVGLEIEDTGFSIPEIDLHIEALNSALDSDAPTLERSKGPVVSRVGDIFLLGRHRISCANAQHKDSYVALLQGKKARIVVTDFPYNTRSKSIGSRGATKHADFVMAAGEMSASEFVRFLSTAMGHLISHSDDGSLQYFFMDWRHSYELLTAAREHYAEQKNLCVWVKTNGGMGAMYRSQHELVFVFKNGRGRHRNNVELGRHGRNRSNVWGYSGMNDFSRQTDEGNLLELHPTSKPVRLLADILLDASARGEIVLDPFLGAGSTLMAAERVGRVCYGMDLDPGYVDVAVRRWQRLTGEQAIHKASGKSFDLLAQKRGRDA